MVNYANGKIYKLVSFQTDKVYIGSTCEKLSARKARHISKYKSFLSGRDNYITSFELIKLGDIDIVLLEEFPCENKEQLHKRERYYIDSNNCVNKVLPTRTYKEYCDENKDKLKEYYENNKEDILEKNKAYRALNKDSIKQHKKEYYEQNKNKYKEHQKIPFVCSCGSTVKLWNKSQHLKTQIHLNSLK
jgi:hypothetical protein